VAFRPHSKGKKQFFFRKKNQKTFAVLVDALLRQEFYLSFSKEKYFLRLTDVAF